MAAVLLRARGVEADAVPPLLVALVLLAVLPATAAAAPPWSDPRTLSAGHLFIEDLGLTATGDGSVAALWSWQDGLPPAATRGASLAVRRPHEEGFGRERVAPVPVGAPVGYARSRLAVLSREPASGGRTRLAVALGGASSGLGRPRTLVVRERLASAGLAGNASGDLAAVWFEDRGVRDDRVQVALRHRGARFGAPLLLARDRVRSVSVAVGARGDVLVAWDARGVVRTRLRPAGSTRFGRVQTIRSQPAFGADLRTAVDGRGRAAVAWASQLRTEGGEAGPVRLQVAVRPVGARAFLPAQLLERLDPARAPRGLDLELDPAGRPVVAWVGHDHEGPRLRVAVADARLRFGVPETVTASARDLALDDLAVGRDGRRLLVWTAFGPGEASQVLAAHAAPGAAFGAQEEVSAAQEARRARAVLDPVSGRATVAWSNRPAGSGGPLASIRTVVQAATRAGG
jgi:hypothetical protein